MIILVYGSFKNLLDGYQTGWQIWSKTENGCRGKSTIPDNINLSLCLHAQFGISQVQALSTTWRRYKTML